MNSSVVDDSKKTVAPWIPHSRHSWCLQADGCHLMGIYSGFSWFIIAWSYFFILIKCFMSTQVMGKLSIVGPKIVLECLKTFPNNIKLNFHHKKSRKTNNQVYTRFPIFNVGPKRQMLREKIICSLYSTLIRKAGHVKKNVILEIFIAHQK